MHRNQYHSNFPETSRGQDVLLLNLWRFPDRGPCERPFRTVVGNIDLSVMQCSTSCSDTFCYCEGRTKEIAARIRFFARRL